MHARITPRDRVIFKSIYENAYMTAPQIRGAVFKSMSSTHQRLFHLVRDGYLEKIRCNEVIYKLSTKALQELHLSKKHKKQYQRKKIVVNQLLHDLGLTDLRQILEKYLSIENWIPSHRLKAQEFLKYQRAEGRKTIVPDAIFDLKAGEKVFKVAFEYERSQKQAKRYATHIEHYHLYMPVDLVIYVVEGMGLKNLLLKILDQKLKQFSSHKLTLKSKLYVALIGDIKKNGVSTPFETIHGQKFHLKEFLKKIENIKNP